MDLTWMDHAACREVGTEPFFAENGSDYTRMNVTKAKAVCHACPVIDACLEYALDLNIAYGVFGGMTERERRAVRRRGEAA